MADAQSHDQERVALRRSPKLSAFVLVSIVVGFFATLILTGLYPADPSVGFTTLFAYFALYGIAGTVGGGHRVVVVGGHALETTRTGSHDAARRGRA